MAWIGLVEWKAAVVRPICRQMALQFDWYVWCSCFVAFSLSRPYLLRALAQLQNTFNRDKTAHSFSVSWCASAASTASDPSWAGNYDEWIQNNWLVRRNAKPFQHLYGWFAQWEDAVPNLYISAINTQYARKVASIVERFSRSPTYR